MSQHREHPDKHAHASNTTRSASLLLSLGALAGVLIWAKLRLVTDIPRSAYAEPHEVDQPGAPTEQPGHESESDEDNQIQDTDDLKMQP